MAQLTDSGQTERQYIEAYGGGGFRVSGARFAGSVLVRPDRTLAWPVSRHADVTLESLAALTAEASLLEILLIGCGASNQLLPRALRDGLRDLGIVPEAMDTGAACRTYNVLMAEDRRVAAALLAI